VPPVHFYSFTFLEIFMKCKTLAAAILAAVAAPAFAIVPGSEPNAYPRLDVYGSGATAIDKQLLALAKQICSAGTLDIFTDSASSPQGSKYSAYYCEITAATVPGLTQPYNLMLHKNSNGGSANGIQPLTNGATEDQMIITTGVGSNCGTASVTTSTGNPVWVCNKANVDNTKGLDFGISDVEPSLFASLGLALGAAPIVSSAMNANTFGLPVTTALYTALQKAQGLTPGSTDVSQAPSLSRSQISSILSGGIQDWTQLKVNNVSLNLVAGVTAPVNTKVQVCRRTADSGTQAQAGVFFNGLGCSANVPTMLGDNTTFDTTADGTTAASNLAPFGAVVKKTIVHEYTGSSGVKDCLSALNTANAWGVGILSLENNSAKYKFVKIDGVAPTLKNVAGNRYGDYFTSTIQWTGAMDAAVVAPAVDKLAVLKTIRSDASNPANIKLINDSLNAPATATPNYTGTDSEVGLLALPYKSSVVNKVYSYANPVATASREGATGTAAPNSCSTPIQYVNGEL